MTFLHYYYTRYVYLPSTNDIYWRYDELVLKFPPTLICIVKNAWLLDCEKWKKLITKKLFFNISNGKKVYKFINKGENFLNFSKFFVISMNPLEVLRNRHSIGCLFVAGCMGKWWCLRSIQQMDGHIQLLFGNSALHVWSHLSRCDNFRSSYLPLVIVTWQGPCRTRKCFVYTSQRR